MYRSLGLLDPTLGTSLAWPITGGLARPARNGIRTSAPWPVTGARPERPLEGASARPGNSTPVVWSGPRLFSPSPSTRANGGPSCASPAPMARSCGSRTSPARQGNHARGQSALFQSPVLMARRSTRPSARPGVVAYDFQGKRLWHR